MRFIK